MSNKEDQSKNNSAERESASKSIDNMVDADTVRRVCIDAFFMGVDLGKKSSQK